MNNIERIAKILELAEIPFSWLKHGEDGKYSLILEDNSSTVSLAEGNGLYVFLNFDVSVKRFKLDDIGDALRVMMEARYMNRMDGVSQPSEKHSEWIE